MIMVPDKENFYVSGPMHLQKSLDWKDKSHRKSVAASLVQGVYVLEKDRQRRGIRHEHDTHVFPWWERFGFQLIVPLVDDTNSSYFGAIYELKYADPFFYQSRPYPPKFVIAFRGTVKQFRTLFEDMKLNLKFVYGHPEESPRVHKALDVVSNYVRMAGAANVWLAGHSLGASIAMLVGRKMAKSRYPLETYLFNPPFNSVPIENLIKNQKLKHNVRVTCSFTKAGLAMLMKRRSEDLEEDTFKMLSEWTPYLFVNPLDPICAEYIGYFQHRNKMEDISMGKIERIAAKYSIISLVSGAIGRELEPLHLLPTAYLTRSLSKDVWKAHKICQWWQQHSEESPVLYKL